MKNRTFLSFLLLTVATAAVAQPSADHYQSIDQTCGATLKSRLQTIINTGKDLENYKKLFISYEKIDYIEGKKNAAGQYQVFDYYSEEVHYFTGNGDAPSGMNKEHTVPQSWWDGSPGCYNDVFQVLPSESQANSSKGNYPLGVVTGSVSYSNKRMKTGKDASGKMVFEPIDEYKGDFARIYFYVATAYPDAQWKNRSDVDVALRKEPYPTLKPEFQELLLKWNEQDPVSEWEMTRQERAALVQKNRNPFIDYPDLANYIWGSKKNTPFDLATAELHVITPVDPVDPDPVDPDPVDPDPVIAGDYTKGTLLFQETFADCSEGNSSNSSGASKTWSGNSQINNVAAGYQAGGAVKLGTSGKQGGFTTTALNYAGGPLIVEIDVKGWTTVEGQLTVSVGSEQQKVDYTATMSDDFETLTLVFNNVPANATIDVQTTNKRCYIDDLRAYVGVPVIPTGITDTTSIRHDSTQEGLYYDLTGRRLKAQPTHPGIYIINGRKVLLR